MGIQYELSAVELLKRLGYEEPSGREELENFMQEKGVYGTGHGLPHA